MSRAADRLVRLRLTEPVAGVSYVTEPTAAMRYYLLARQATAQGHTAASGGHIHIYLTHGRIKYLIISTVQY